MNISLTVTSRHGNHLFEGQVHTAYSPREFYLDPEGFYLKWGGSVPEGAHLEIEIVRPSHDELQQYKLHVHKSDKSGKPFMCYPKHIPTIKQAQELFRTWCLGTVLKIVEDLDLNTVFTECDNDTVKFAGVVRSRFNIAIIAENIS